ncbi:protodermal factor 1 [Argentina anserina]|uniref:protodermal factor 1 n=1 Tax=Argentina anserina TaxID=57926 RepID=UPI0021762CD3|nr:protodermal factor 1 [Potentilla anserina]
MRNKASSSLFIWALVAGMLTHNLVIPVISTTLEDQKNYYTPDLCAVTPPSGNGGSPPGGSHGSPPSHHHHNPPSHGGYSYSPPSHGGYSPSPSPPSYCGTPSSRPSTPSTPSRPTTPTPTPTYGTPPSGGSPPVIVSPPLPFIGTPPIDPGTPGVPTPPYLPDPNSPPFTCTYWRNHPTVIWGLVGWWATLGHSFGLTSVPGFGSGSMNLHQALSNTRTDGLGELYREGTASLLNSMVDNRFHFTTAQVRDGFVRGLRSNKVATNQARLFRLANEGKLKPRA